MNEQELVELLEDYLEGRVDGGVKTELESRLASDAELREQLELLKFTKNQLKDIGLWREINTVHNRFKANKKKDATRKVISIFAKRWIGFAASFLLILAFISISLNQIQPSKIVSDNYMEYKVPVMRSEEAEKSLDQLFFQQRDWDNLLEWVEKNPSNGQQPYFFAGLASYEKGAYLDALKYFKTVEEINAASPTKLFGQEIDYYSSLAYLQSEKYKDAYRLIEKMKEDQSHVYHDVFGSWDLFRISVLKFKKTK